jgi:uncharacterized protein YacL
MNFFSTFKPSQLIKLIKMNALYVAGGVAITIFGIWFTLNQVKAYKAMKKEHPKSDYKGVGVGIILIILGLAIAIMNIKS